MKKALLAAALGIFLPVIANAQFVTAVKVAPAQIQAGQETKITVDFDTPRPNCGLRLHFGDGVTRDFKINQTKDVPLVVTYKYGMAGDFRVMTEPKREGMIAGCGRKNMETFIKVTAAPPAPGAPAPAKAAPAKAAAAAPECPSGWALVAKSVNKKTGAFTCSAKAGTTPPAGKLECPGDLGYFENAKKGQLGCRI